jgi:hypothetical protein
MNITECKVFHWYEVIDGCGIIEDGSTIQFINISDTGNYCVIGESRYDEMGISLSKENAIRVCITEIFF